MKSASKEEFFCKGKFRTGAAIKSRLLREGYPHICATCTGGPMWMGLPLSLQVDHVNGDNTDNRVENLQLLCPNCHSQTSTYSGRNAARLRQVKMTALGLVPTVNKCIKCSKEISVRATCCLSCAPRKGKIIWPPLVEVEAMLEKSTAVAVAKVLGVSDTAIHRYIKRRKANPYLAME